ncbi:MAG TPA: PilZ domain-containing protein [Phycisphaerales bacterium]|nr:PilZ domain-containing protein [Phycisphaerales bacterium]
MQQPHDNPAPHEPLSAARRRVFARWPFSQQIVPVRDLSSLSRDIIPMTCRNLSANGVGLVSSRPLAVGRTVSVTLRSVVRGTVNVQGRVVRCEDAGERRCELGVAFATPIDVREFAPTDPLSNQTLHETIDPQTLRGSVLIVSGCPGDRASLARSLRTTSMIVASVASVHGARDIAAADIAILTSDTGDDEPGSVLLDLYERGFAGKVVLIAPDRGPRVRRIVEKLPLAGVLVKPLEDTALLRLLADIGAEGTGASLRNVA